VASQPALRRTNPLRDVVPAPPGAALGGGLHAAEAGRLRDELRPLQETLRPLAAAEVERDDGAEARHLDTRQLVPWIVRETRVADRLHSGSPGEQLRDRHRIRAPPLQPKLERGERAVGQPGLERPGDAAGLPPPGPQGLGTLGAAGGHVAEQQVGVPGKVLGGAADRQVGAELQRPLTERRGGRVVHGGDRSPLAGRRGEVRHVAHLKTGVDPALGQVAARHAAQVHVAVRRDHGGVAGAQLGQQDRRGGRLPEANSTTSPTSSSDSARS
jgi:hypothetical protein